MSAISRRARPRVISLFAILAALLSLAAFAAPAAYGQTTSPPSGPGVKCAWAEHVVDYSPGDILGTDNADATRALNATDFQFVSLGKGGSITLEFLSRQIADGLGDDFAIREYGSTIETATVFASENGIDFVELGLASGELSFFDLAGTGLTNVAFIRIVDDGDDTDITPYAGFDLDAIGVINCNQIACAYGESVHTYTPGADLTGTPIPANALGAADGTFVSLGTGGMIILELGPEPLADHPGDDFDLLVYEIKNPEGATVFASADGIAFSLLGEAWGAASSFDLGAAGLASASFIKIIDDGIDTTGGTDTLGFDLDAIASLNCDIPTSPAVAIEKATNGDDADTATGPEIAVGDPVLWTYLVTNTGDVDLIDIHVADNMGVAVTCPLTALAVGGSMTCTADGTATLGQYANIGLATGVAPSGVTVLDEDPSHYIGIPVTVCDPDPENDLTGHIEWMDGEAWGFVTNTSPDCSYPVGLASYEKFDEVIDNQEIFDWTTAIIGPDTTIDIHVALPPCAVQVDLFYGEVLMSLDGVRYGTRKLDWVHLGGTDYCPLADWDGGTGSTDLAHGVKVNFQPMNAAIPDDYLADTGLAFATHPSGLDLGWNAANGYTRDRGANADQRYDTLNHMQKSGNLNASWEIAVDDGTYEVYIVAGDPSHYDSVYQIDVEDTLAINGTPSSTNRFFDNTVTVIVTDGKLTVSNAVGASNNKISFLHITFVSADTTFAADIVLDTVVLPDLSYDRLKINFQKDGVRVPTGYIKDAGHEFAERASGYLYGWNDDNFYGRDRNNWRSRDQRYDTLNHMQKSGNPDASWEIALPNGTYEVRIVAGDASYYDSVYKIDVEGTLAIDGTPRSDQRWFRNTVIVEVADGKLTIGNADGARNNKIDWIRITAMS